MKLNASQLQWKIIFFLNPPFCSTVEKKKFYYYHSNFGGFIFTLKIPLQLDPMLPSTLSFILFYFLCGRWETFQEYVPLILLTSIKALHHGSQPSNSSTLFLFIPNSSFKNLFSFFPFIFITSLREILPLLCSFLHSDMSRHLLIYIITSLTDLLMEPKSMACFCRLLKYKY